MEGNETPTKLRVGNRHAINDWAEMIKALAFP